MSQPQIRICFVCLGNICRSPTAEGVMQKLLDDAGLSDRFFIDSAGTGASHVGERADSRSRAEAQRRGIELTSRARKLVAEDLDTFDYLIAMDSMNERDIKRRARAPGYHAKVALLRSFQPGATQLDVPDPYYGGERGFADVYDLCFEACSALLTYLRREHKL